MTNIGAGGEEWRRMDKTSGYDPAAYADVISTAKENIPRIRQRDVTLQVTDRAGKPLVNLPVQIEQKK